MEPVGSTSEPDPIAEPRAYVVRLPGAFMGAYTSEGSKYTCFQTIVCAQNEAMAVSYTHLTLPTNREV